MNPAGSKTATFAGGCFWCMEPAFDALDGVFSTRSGYAGGQVENPTYEQVCNGTTGHAEALQVVYDPKKISYKELLETFWQNIDPTVKNRQFCDVGTQYRSAIFPHNQEQQDLAQASKTEIEKRLKVPVYTTLEPFKVFYPAEEYHQDFYKKNPERYYSYRNACGRDTRLKQLWSKE